MPDATGLELIAHELRDKDADAVLDTTFFRDKAALTVTAASIRETLAHLRGKGFNFLASRARRSTTTPRSRASASSTSCWTCTRSTA